MNYILRTCLLIAFVFSCFPALSNDPPDKKELKKLLENYQVDDEVRKLLAAHSLYLSIDTFSRILLDDSLVIKVLTEAPEGQADGLILLAFLESDMGNFGNATTLLKQAVSLSEKNNYKTGITYKSFYNGLQAYENKDTVLAEKFFLDCINELDKEKQILDIYSPLSALRIFYNITHQYEKKFNFYKSRLVFYEKNGPHENIGSCYHGIGNYYMLKGNYEKMIEFYSRAAENWKSWGNENCYFVAQSVVAEKYIEWGNYDHAKNLLMKPEDIELSKVAILTYTYAERVRMQLAMVDKDYNTALKICKDLLRMHEPLGEGFALINNIELSKIYLQMGIADSAKNYLDQVNAILQDRTYSLWNGNGDIEYDYCMALYYRLKNQPEDALASMQAALMKARAENYTKLINKYLFAIADLLASMQQYQMAYSYLQEQKMLNDSLDHLGQESRISLYETDRKEKMQEQELLLSSQKNERQRIISLSVTAGLILLLVFSIVLYNRFRFSKKQAAEIAREKEMVEHQRQRAENSIQELKAAQTQLIQSEKMASLGELTAGIAHEIQNPLNFVNNFSELSNDLLDEISDVLKNNKPEEVADILKSLRVNLEKINHHGKRADNIVKSMLMHSRQNAGEKQPTDINELTDEYLKLAYHGLRAKEKNFTAVIKTDYDKSIAPMNLVQQDMGRVILNLTNNACYAVSQKKRTDSYEPTVVVSTKKVNGKVEIKIRDNGNGIPRHIVDKIFQPFFTTKPTGQGTGLGLSLSYDVIQAHGGNIEVKSEEGVGSEFRILLPA